MYIGPSIRLPSERRVESGDHSASDSELMSPAEQESHSNVEDTATESRRVVSHNENTEDGAEDNTTSDIPTGVHEDCNSSFNIDDDDNATHTPDQVDGADETTPCNSYHI